MIFTNCTHTVVFSIYRARAAPKKTDFFFVAHTETADHEEIFAEFYKKVYRIKIAYCPLKSQATVMLT